MEVRVLQYFLAVAREESISKAATALHLSQPTLSTQLKNLEEELGKQLMIRGPRKITLTEEGLLLRKRAEEIVTLIKKTESEISLSDQTDIQGDVFIGASETDAIRILAKVAHTLQLKYPEINYHISSGNASYIIEQLDNGLIDFGILFGSIDSSKYNFLQLPMKDTWGVLMRKDSPLAKKQSIVPKDLHHLPLILSQQEIKGGKLSVWMGNELPNINVVATYNLIYNASLLVEEGVGYALAFDKIINVSGNSKLCFRPLSPSLEDEIHLVWKKYQLFSKPVEKFLSCIQETVTAAPLD